MQARETPRMYTYGVYELRPKSKSSFGFCSARDYLLPIDCFAEAAPWTRIASFALYPQKAATISSATVYSLDTLFSVREAQLQPTMDQAMMFDVYGQIHLASPTLRGE